MPQATRKQPIVALRTSRYRLATSSRAKKIRLRIPSDTRQRPNQVDLEIPAFATLIPCARRRLRPKESTRRKHASVPKSLCLEGHMEVVRRTSLQNPQFRDNRPKTARVRDPANTCLCSPSSGAVGTVPRASAKLLGSSSDVCLKPDAQPTKSGLSCARREKNQSRSQEWNFGASIFGNSNFCPALCKLVSEPQTEKIQRTIDFFFVRACQRRQTSSHRETNIF